MEKPMETPLLSKKRKKDLQALAEFMNSQNVSGIPINSELIDCFNLVITPEETKFLLEIGTDVHTYEDLAGLTGLADESSGPFLETLIRKGLLWPKQVSGRKDYMLAPILVGWFEIYLSDGRDTPEKREFARRVDRYFNSFSKYNFFPVRNFLNYRLKQNSRPTTSVYSTGMTGREAKSIKIDLGHRVEVPATRIFPTRSVYELVEKCTDKNQIAVVHCVCRQLRKFVDEPCRFEFPAEACIAVGLMAEHAVDYGIGRYISKEEALQLIRDIQTRGAIHQVIHDRGDIDAPEMAICNCCWDCCGILGSYNRGLMPLHVKAFFYAEVNQDVCQGCGRCEKYCPTGAAVLTEERSSVSVDKCIGCGQCVFHCPDEAIGLVPQERELFLPILKKSEARLAQ
jgi:ferredoxin